MSDLKATIPAMKEHCAKTVQPLMNQLKVISGAADKAEKALLRAKFSDAAKAAAAIP